jgi:hypothetical protein
MRAACSEFRVQCSVFRNQNARPKCHPEAEVRGEGPAKRGRQRVAGAGDESGEKDTDQ